MIGSIVEKPSSSPKPPLFVPPSAPTPGGFPRAAHRSKSTSLFAQARSKPSPSRQIQAPVVQSTIPIPPPPRSRYPLESHHDQSVSEERRIIESAQRENEERIAGMSLDEREQEARELVERFGGGLADLLRKRREAREAKENSNATSASLSVSQVSVDSNSDEPASSPSITAPKETQEEPSVSKTVRFATNPESMPASFQSTISNQPISDPISPEDTPASILSQYFPTDTTYDPSKLEWLQPLPSNSTTLAPSAPSSSRYDLSGQPISISRSASLPTHLGLHHHGDDPGLAGYTLDEVLHLCLSTSVSQRVAMLDVLSKIVRVSARLDTNGILSQGEEAAEAESLAEKALEIAGRSLEEGRGGVNVISRGIEIIYEVLVGSGAQGEGKEEEDVEIHEEVIDGVLAPGLEGKDRSILVRLPGLIPLLVVQLGNPGLMSRTNHQLLAILVRMARLPDPVGDLLLSSSSVNSVSSSSPLLQSILRNLSESHPDPLNLILLHALVVSSRKTAERLTNHPSSPLPALLRFVALGSSSPHLLILARLSIDIYSSLGRYGLLSFICSDGSDIWRNIEITIHQNLRTLHSATPSWPSVSHLALARSFYSLLTSWTVCATDPHQTSPEHDITWSQVQGMGWFPDALVVLSGLLSMPWSSTGDTAKAFLVSVMGFVRAWIEGSKVNEPKGGEEVRLKVGQLAGLQVDKAEELSRIWAGSVQAELQKSEVSWSTVARTIRLMDGLIRLVDPSQASIEKLDETLGQTFDVLLTLSSHWSSKHVSFLDVRPITSFLTAYLLHKRSFLPTADWLSLALDVLRLLVPGDEPLARSLLEVVFALDLTEVPGGKTLLDQVGHRHGFWILEPFFYFVTSPSEESHIAPSFPMPRTLKQITSLRLPSARSSTSSPSSSSHPQSKCGLPLSPTWFFSPMDELLHSSSSRAFASAPPSWDASEPELVRATLAFARLVQTLPRSSLSSSNTTDKKNSSISRLNPSQVMYECMKIFLLEKGVVAPLEEPSKDEEGKEVFRDPGVEALVRDLLKPSLFWSSSYNPPRSSPFPSGLEQAHALSSISAPSSTMATTSGGQGGQTKDSSTPFFQTYTDFHALYSSISYAHPIFSSLLLPPLAMGYEKDYRALFWNGENVGLLPGFTTQVAHVLCEYNATQDDNESSGKRIEPYFYPQETQTDILGSYLRALVLPLNSTQGRPGLDRDRTEFLYWVAIHHLTSAIFSPESVVPKAAGTEVVVENRKRHPSARSFLLALLEKAGDVVLSDLVKYNQPERSISQTQSGQRSMRFPPGCYDLSGLSSSEIKARLDLVRGWAGERGVSRIKDVGFGRDFS
ncbi:Uncharacterized conserved protein [Phaffia rhodozyma]|uniref:Uncharacterized conserved protein n=1 Tax=Phaffia rhodozyma TaxID=264483 RepID=A0A0F7SLU8_PHARH|nr:Uncharacterized conserved protein [Phaffia rhodozyma]